MLVTSKRKLLGDATKSHMPDRTNPFQNASIRNEIVQPVALTIINTHFLVVMRLWETPVLIPNTMVKT